MGMKVDIRVGETVRFSGEGSASVSLVAKSGQVARLEINADDTVKIERPAREGAAAMVVKAGLAKR